MNDKKAQFLPFHTINEFMRNDYRANVVRYTLNTMPALPDEIRSPVERLTRKAVKVPGFRNSAKAPASMRVKPTIEAFEKNPTLVAAILSAWCEAHAELRQQVYDLLTERGWEVLPPEADRTKLPGFITRWPKGEDFETLNAAFVEMYPDLQIESDDVSLMVVWVSVRLPYDIEEDEEGENEDKASEG
jgi:hypothetical protein